MALTSKAPGSSTSQLRTLSSWSSGCRLNHGDNDEQFYDWYTLAMRLQGSWPESLQFCHHGLMFLPTLCFSPQLFATDKLICLDCIRFRVEIPRCPAHLTNCTGCLLVQERLGEEELHESPHDSDSGAHMRKSALRRGR